jgi:sigma-B regulation protein RsbU (phosphoserine phosphatase)
MAHDPAQLARDLQTILGIAQAMSSERDLDRLLDLIVTAVGELSLADRTSLFIVDQERQELWTRISQGGGRIRLPLGSGIAGTVAASGITINIPHAYGDPRFNRDNDRRSGYITRSILCMPLSNHLGAVVGVIQALNKRTSEPFSAYDEQVLAALAGNAAVAIDNAQLIARDRDRQRMERDLEVARQIQLGLLPATPPQLARWRLAAWAQSCDQTGGDYYDFIALIDGGVDVVVGDVSGHGIAAALMMSTARAFLRALHEQDDRPEIMMTRLNRLLEQDLNDESFMTLVLCRLGADGSCSYVAAGHEPPLVHRRAGGRDELESSGLPLGMLSDSGYEATTLALLAPGDLLVLCTDGISEAQAPPDFAMWGGARLRAVVAAHADAGAPAVCAAVVAAVKAHLGPHQPHDDMTLVVIERLAEAGSP